MIVNKNKPLKRPFEEAEWENVPITFSPADYKQAEGEPDVMMPHADPFVATVYIGNHNVNKVFIDTSSSLDILYWSCFQKMKLNPSSLQKYEGPVYGFDNQPVPVEGVMTLSIYVGSEPRFRMASVNFLVVKMESACNAILGRATLYELKAVISQPHLSLRDSFGGNRSTQPDQQTMSISNIEHRPVGVEQKAEPVETVLLNPDVPKRTVKIGTKLTEEERAELLEFLRVNQDVFAWITDEMLGIPTELTVHKLSFIRRVEYSEWVSNPLLVKKQNGKWRMYIEFTNLNEACPKDPHPLPNVEKLVERAVGHKRMSFLDASSSLKNVGATYQKLVQIIFKLQIGRNIEIYVDDMIVTSVRAEDHIADLSETFQNLHRAQMKLNPLKCTFAVESRKFLGYVVSKKGIEVNPEKVQAVQQMEPPKTVKDVQRLTAPLLSKPVEGESLYLYLGVTKEVISSILLREENKHQKPICYVSKVLQGAEQNYPLAKKAVFALVYTARKLRAYFQSHQIVVYTNLPLRKILQKPELFGRLIGWSVELSEYDLKFQLCTTIKGQAVADFLVECISATVEEKATKHPIWVLYVDGATNIEGSGVGAVLLSPDGFKFEHALRFKFQTTNNAAEYEALIYGLKLASELKVQSIKVFSDSQLVFDKIPRADNQRADKLLKLASLQDINPHRSTIVEVLDAPSYTDFTIECQLLRTEPSSPSWTTPLIDYLHSGELPEDPFAAKLIKRRVAHFILLDNQLYKRATLMSLLRCFTPYKAEYNLGCVEAVKDFNSVGL
ncbi:hypothetical protein SLEP1_g16762 [Rubroshorea leprosula]|uniref:RNA-directed DNA polymerase n=1 Tax=Rubroshorea leprosula TaxID=152421 RepID=A0AAV5IXQ6_9ROSI|nr:hypothetical protein SLEP1_g16762 [Rubroshorea leprosula]